MTMLIITSIAALFIGCFIGMWMGRNMAEEDYEAQIEKLATRNRWLFNENARLKGTGK